MTIFQRSISILTAIKSTWSW